jgi:pimeloyl-ACP methyl ester carboxylesterase
VKVPEIQYARSGDVSLAYVVSGEGSFDLVFVHGFVGNLETAWEQPLRQAFFERLGAFSRVIEFDRRGTGLSDRVRDVPTLESRMDDLRAVMDAAGSERAAVFATFEAGAMAALYAATYPERVAALVLYNPIAKGEWSPDYPFAPTEAEWSSELPEIRERWGPARVLCGIHSGNRSVSCRRSGVRGLDGEALENRGEPGRRACDPTHGQGRRHQGRPAFDPRADARPTPRRACRRVALCGRADSWGPPGRDLRFGHHLLSRPGHR